MVWDFLNWQTLIFEAIYAGILTLVFFLIDRRRGRNQEQILNKLDEFQQRQERMDKSIRQNSFFVIATFIELMNAGLEEDLRELDRNVIHHNSKMTLVEQRRSQHSPYRLFMQTMERELNTIRWIVQEELYQQIQSIIHDLKKVCGEYPYPPDPNLVEEWRRIAVNLIPKSEQLRTRLLEIIAKEDPSVLQREERAIGWGEFQQLRHGY